MHCDAATLAQAARLLASSRQVVVFTGAGASAESGIATFRDSGGLWSEFPPEHFANWAGLLRTAALRPRQVARFTLALLEPIAAAVPNPGHRAVAELQRHVPVAVITQNIDGLHSEAGSRIVHEIHGSVFRVVTPGGTVVRRLTRSDLLGVVSSLRRGAEGRFSHARLLWAVRPIFGVGRRGLYRPGVVMFGQPMAEPDWTLAQQAAAACDCMITVGTSEAVMPAAALPAEAAAAGARVIRIDPTPGFGHLWLAGPAAAVLPALVEAAFGRGEQRG